MSRLLSRDRERGNALVNSTVAAQKKDSTRVGLMHSPSMHRVPGTDGRDEAGGAHDRGIMYATTLAAPCTALLQQRKLSQLASSLAQEETPSAPLALDMMQDLGSCVKEVDATSSAAGTASRTPVGPPSRGEPEPAPRFGGAARVGASEL